MTVFSAYFIVFHCYNLLEANSKMLNNIGRNPGGKMHPRKPPRGLGADLAG